MAQFFTETFLVTVSRMTRDSDPSAALMADDFAHTLEAVITELVPGSLVEVTGEHLD